MTVIASAIHRPARPLAMPGKFRLFHPDDYSVFIGRAHYWHALRVPLEEHMLIVSPPRKGKSALLSRMILHYPGAVVSTTTRPDIYRRTQEIRRDHGRIDVFNPQAIGRVPSTMAWDVIAGCGDPDTAIRRADQFAFAASAKGIEDSQFWASKASDYLRGMFYAAAYARTAGYRYGLGNVTRWALGSAEEAEDILQDAKALDWQAQLSELRGDAQKTAQTVRMVMSRALSFMMHPGLAAAVQPVGDDPGFSIESFVKKPNSLYMIASGQDENSPLSPLFAALTGEIHYQAGMIGSLYPSGRLPHPMLFALDEVTQICPVPLPEWQADSGGKGIQIFAVAHGFAQLRERWGVHGAQIIKDTAGAYIVLPGIKDEQTLESLSTLCGTVTMAEHGSENHSQHPVMTPAMIRQLPNGRGLVVRDNLSPVVFKPARVFDDRLYKRARKAPQPVPVRPPKAIVPGEVLDPLPESGAA